MKRKSLLIIIGSILAVLLVMVGGSAFLIYRALKPILSHRRPTPPELVEPRIITGAGFLTRSQFAQISEAGVAVVDPDFIGTIEEMRVGEFDPHPGIDIVLAGGAGSLVLDRTGQKQASVKYDFGLKQVKLGPFSSSVPRLSVGEMKIIDIEGDGVCEYLGNGGSDLAVVFNHRGERLWSLPWSNDRSRSFEEMTAGDLNGDGVAEFVAGGNGIEVFDRDGKRLWQQPLEFGPSQLAVVDVDGDGKNEIVSAGAEITIRDAAGKELRSVEVEGYLGTISLCSRPGQKIPSLLDVEEGYISLIDFDGKTVSIFGAPLTEFHDPHEDFEGMGLTNTSVYRAKAVWVKLQADKPEYLAVVTEFAVLDRSVLYVYSAAGELVYQEVLPERSTSLAVLPAEDSNAPGGLLVAGSNTLWRYVAK